MDGFHLAPRPSNHLSKAINTVVRLEAKLDILKEAPELTDDEVDEMNLIMVDHFVKWSMHTSMVRKRLASNVFCV